MPAHRVAGSKTFASGAGFVGRPLVTAGVKDGGVLMGAFDALNIAGSSLGMHQTWLDALASNISNANTVRSTDENAFQAQMVIAQAQPGGNLGNGPLARGAGNLDVGRHRTGMKGRVSPGDMVHACIP